MKKNIILRTAVILIPVLLLAGCGRSAVTADSAQESADTPTPIPVITMEDSDHNDDPVTVAPEVEETGEETVEEESETVFTSEEISDEVFARMQGNSFCDGCTTAREDLRYLKLSYKDIDGNTHEGEMVCNKKIADIVTDIFRQLYEADYPIEKMVLIDEYAGDDNASMSDNNTSCFNYRVVEGTTNLSKHAMGLAIDLNPRYNPYVHKVNGAEAISPENGTQYADRSADFPYKIDKEDLAYRLFTQAGFTWGGSWKSVKDYQHFQYDK